MEPIELPLPTKQQQKKKQMAAETDATIKDLKDAEWPSLPHSIELANSALLQETMDLGEQEWIKVNLIM